MGGYVDSSASPRWQPFTQTAEELSGTFVRAPGAEETEHPRESQSPGFGLVRKDSERVFFFSAVLLDRSSLSPPPIILFFFFFFFFYIKLLPAQVLRHYSGDVQICAHEKTEMNHLDVASRSSAPIAA